MKSNSKKQEYKIAVCLSYCTNDYRLFQKCLSEIKPFSSQILVITCDRFFKGASENIDLLHQTYQENPDIQFIQFSYLKDRLYSRYINRSPLDNDWIDYWHATTRYIPYFYLQKDIEYVLFLDSDEIIEHKKFQNWLNTSEYKKYDAMRFLQYYYFREAKYRAKKFQIGGLFAKKSVLYPSLLMDGDDRCGIFHHLKGNKIEGMAFENTPMIHHYSWVKTKEECLQKAKNWCHHWEKDWIKLIHQEFSRSFNGRDFIDNREYEEIKKPYFDPLSISYRKKRTNQKTFPNVSKIDDRVILKKELFFEFQI